MLIPTLTLGLIISIQDERPLSCIGSKECSNTKPLKTHSAEKYALTEDGCEFSIRLNDCGEFCGGANLVERQLSHFHLQSATLFTLLGELLISSFD